MQTSRSNRIPIIDAGFIALYALLVLFGIELVAWVFFKRVKERTIVVNDRNRILEASSHAEVCSLSLYSFICSFLSKILCETEKLRYIIPHTLYTLYQFN